MDGFELFKLEIRLCVDMKLLPIRKQAPNHKPLKFELDYEQELMALWLCHNEEMKHKKKLLQTKHLVTAIWQNQMLWIMLFIKWEPFFINMHKTDLSI